MKGLLYKDFALTKQRMSTLLLMLGAGACLSLTTDGAFAVTYLTILAVITGIGTQAYDEFDNGYPFLFTLPATRKDYVNAKYIFCFLCALVGWFFSILVYILSGMIRRTGIHADDLMTALHFIPVAMVMISVMLPIRLKYGSEKSRIVTGIFTAILVALVTLTSTLVSAEETQQLVSFISFNDILLLLILTGAAVLIMDLTRRLSIRIMQNKEF